LHGCGLCVENCPGKDKADPTRKAINMAAQPPLRESESKNWEFFLTIPDPDRTTFEPNTVKNSQLLRPLFEFSGACAGCGETPYIKLLTQLFGDRTLIANATVALHLWRQHAHYSLHLQRRRTRSSLVQLTVRR
jgi:pyruvate-ferredoxin/flavodoxin oxidoreductase